MPHEWDVDVPPGWEPVAKICREMFDDRARITDQINTKIQREIEEFTEGTSPVSRSDLSWSTGGGVEHFVRGVARRQPARELDLSFQRLVGQRSAMAGVPLQPLITAYHVGFRELWSILAHRAKGGPAADLLLERGSIVWERLGATATAVADGYQQEMARREAFGSTATAHLLEVLAQDPHADEAMTLAKELEFDPAGTFQVVALGGPIGVTHTAHALAGALRSSGAPAATTQRGRTAVVIAQAVEPAVFDDAVEQMPEGTAVGIGGAAASLPGAWLSLLEAEQALAVAMERAGSCRFDDDWLLATLTSHRGSAHRLLADGIAVATTKRHLAEAVRVFGRSGFSVAQSARSLTLSPNSVRYRLTKWHELTGWDPWSFDGLSRSILAIDLAASLHGAGGLP